MGSWSDWLLFFDKHVLVCWLGNKRGCRHSLASRAQNSFAGSLKQVMQLTYLRRQNRQHQSWKLSVQEVGRRVLGQKWRQHFHQSNSARSHQNEFRVIRTIPFSNVLLKSWSYPQSIVHIPIKIWWIWRVQNIAKALQPCFSLSLTTESSGPCAVSWWPWFARGKTCLMMFGKLATLVLEYLGIRNDA